MFNKYPEHKQCFALWTVGTQTVFRTADCRKTEGDTERDLDAMANIITDDTIEYVSILAKLELSDEECVQAKKDMERMLDYIDGLNELDTSAVEPMSHILPVQNVFREDVVTNGDYSKETLQNAPREKDSMFVVPKTFT